MKMYLSSQEFRLDNFLSLINHQQVTSAFSGRSIIHVPAGYYKRKRERETVAMWRITRAKALAAPLCYPQNPIKHSSPLFTLLSVKHHTPYFWRAFDRPGQPPQVERCRERRSGTGPTENPWIPRPPRRTRPGGGFSGPFVTSKVPSSRMNESGPGNDLIRGLHPRLGTRRSGGRVMAGRREGGAGRNARRVLQDAPYAIHYYTMRERGARSSKRATLALLRRGRKGRRKSFMELAPSAADRLPRVRTLGPRGLALPLSSLLFVLSSSGPERGRERKGDNRSLFSYSSGERWGARARYERDFFSCRAMILDRRAQTRSHLRVTHLSDVSRFLNVV